MEKRKYTFYDRYQKVKYANITAEELEVLNISYNKEHYMFDQQHQRNNTAVSYTHLTLPTSDLV